MRDLHIEFQENSRYLKHDELLVPGDVLVLAGDIFYLTEPRLLRCPSGNGLGELCAADCFGQSRMLY